MNRWTAAYITRVLRNQFYAGTIVYNKQYIPDYLEQKARKNRGEVEQIVVEGTHEPIVSKEDFEKVQAILDRHTKPSVSGIEQQLVFLNIYGVIKCYVNVVQILIEEKIM